MKNSTFPRMHVSYYVSNIKKSVKFYQKFFDKEPEKVMPGYAKFILKSPSLIISFVEHPERVKNNFGHFGFQVENAEELNRRLGESMLAELPINEEMGVTCCYAKQDKFWVTDPDGIQWEIYQFHEDAEFNDPKYEVASSCCPSEPVNDNVEVA